MGIARVTVNLGEEILEELKKIAEQEGKSVSSLVREAVITHLTQGRKKRIAQELLNTLKDSLKTAPTDEQAALKELERIRKEWR